MTVATRTAKGCVAAALMVCAGTAAAADKEPIEIGMAVALTGYLASFDGQLVDGVKLRADSVNAAGGIDGHKLDIHILDDASNATTGVTVTNQLLNQFNVSVMINGLSSAQNAAIEPILERAKVPQLDGSVLPPNPKWAFDINLLDERPDALEVDYAAEKLHAKIIALVYSQTPYGQNAAKFMRARAEKLGMRVVYSQAVEPSVTDMSAQMAALKAASPDVVIDKLTGSTHIVEGKAAATVGLRVPLILDPDDLPTIQKTVEAYPNSVFVATPPMAYPHIADPATKEACAAFIATYQKTGRSMAAITGTTVGWDGVRILAKAIESAGTTGGDKLRDALEQTTVQGCNSLYKYSAADHYGQNEVPNEVQIARMNGGDVEIVYNEPGLKLAE